MTPTSGANARAANAAEAVPARRPLSRPWKPPPRAGRCGSSSAGSPTSAGSRSKAGRCAIYVPPARSTATASTPSVASLTRQRFAYEPREGRCRLLPSVDRHGLRQEGGQDPRFQVGQYPARQPQDQSDRHLPRHPRQARPTLSRPVPIPLQPPLRSGRHDPPSRLGRCPDPAHALSAPQIG